MKRRHLLALVIVALVVATVLAVVPVRVWDALTLVAVERRNISDTTLHYSVRRWRERTRENAVGPLTGRIWYPNGQLKCNTPSSCHKACTLRRMSRNGRTTAS